nr:probable LRR receptor-like serine/threonine-protein kinase RKF3 [Ipomoea batatas]
MVRQSAPQVDEAGTSNPIPRPDPVATRAFDPTDRTNPLHLHPNESPALQLVTVRLEGRSNYHPWARAMEMALRSKNKLRIVDGTMVIPSELDQKYYYWDQCNTMVLSWILRAVSPTIGQSVLWINTAEGVWKDLKKRFSQQDVLRIGEIQSQIHQTKQVLPSENVTHLHIDEHIPMVSEVQPMAPSQVDIPADTQPAVPQPRKSARVRSTPTYLNDYNCQSVAVKNTSPHDISKFISYDNLSHEYKAFAGLRLVQSDYLRRTNSFLPPLVSAQSCWDSYQAVVNGFLPGFDIRTRCGFQTSWISQGCMNITTRPEFESNVSAAALSSVVSACNQSLDNNSPCATCTTSLSSLSASYLTGPSIGNVSDCTAYPSIYAAAFANRFGPTDKGTAKCLFGLDSSSPSSGSGKKKAATKNFSRVNIIGMGGYGNVYKGVLSDGSEIAVKRFKNCSLAGDASFAHEVGVIASVRHVNLVALRGYCTTTSFEGHQRIIPTLVADWAWALVRERRALDVIEDDMPELGVPAIMEKYVLVAVLCSHPQLYARPTMDQVVKMLDTDVPVPMIPERPVPLIAGIEDIERSVSSSGSGYLSTSAGYQPYAFEGNSPKAPEGNGEDSVGKGNSPKAPEGGGEDSVGRRERLKSTLQLLLDS